jgi:hypothetical protein
VVLVDPAAGGELTDGSLVELAPRGIVDVLDAGGRQLELGVLEQPTQAPVFTGEALGVHQ